MFDEKYEVHPEIARSLAPQQEVEVQEQAAEQAPTEKVEVQQPQPEKPAENNPIKESWRQLRLAKEKAEKERDEALRYASVFAKASPDTQMNQRYEQPKQAQSDQEEDVRIGADELVEGKHLKSYNKKLENLQQQLRMQQQQSYTENSKLRLKAKYPDFDSVVNQDTIEMLSVLQPEIAQTLNASTDIYSTGVTAYTLIKNLGLKPEETYREDVERIKMNAAKPKPLASINPQQGESALSKANAFANGLTNELRAQLMKEMNEARKNI